MANGLTPWENAPQFTNIAASQQGGSRGAQFWGIQIDNQLNTIYQVTPGGSWSGWMGPGWAGSEGPPLVFDVTQQLNAKRPVVVVGTKAAVDLVGRKDKTTPLGEVDNGVEQSCVGHDADHKALQPR